MAKSISQNTYPSDEPTLFDYLDDSHHNLVRQTAVLVRECTPPYVIGIYGSWGSGKTSLLDKLWSYLNGTCRKKDIEISDEADEALRLKGKASNDEREQALTANQLKFNQMELVWFSPWQHQFEESPAVALLQEIRSHFTLAQKAKGNIKKIFDVTIYSALHLIDELANIVQAAENRGEKLENENYEMRLFSQHFLQTFQEAIKKLLESVGKKRLVIFIDDLDRCRSDNALKLIEALKLYLNAANCVYVMAMDRRIIEDAIRKEKSGDSDKEDLQTITMIETREYLEKIVQTSFLVPRPVSITSYIEHLLKDEKSTVQELGKKWFNKCLPHNPRKIKAYITAYRLYLKMLEAQFIHHGLDKTHLNIEYAAVLCYLAHFEDEIYRAVESDPAYFETVFYFCNNNTPPDYRFEHLVIPTELLKIPEKESAINTYDIKESDSKLAAAVVAAYDKQIRELEKSKKKEIRHKKRNQRTFHIAHLLRSWETRPGTSILCQHLLNYLPEAKI
jgi:hypothetical protein